MTVLYTNENGDTLEITFDYDPDLFDEEDPSQSPWNYIIIDEILDSDGNDVELSEDELYDLKIELWKEYKNEF